jgi:hypothetical protein
MHKEQKQSGAHAFDEKIRSCDNRKQPWEAPKIASVKPVCDAQDFLGENPGDGISNRS